MEYNRKTQRWPADYLSDYPLHALEAIWDDADLLDVIREIPIWYSIVVSHESASYYEHQEREDLAVFMYDLLHLLEAMYFLFKSKLQSKDKPEADIEALKKNLSETEGFEWIDYEEMANPESVITEFVLKYDHKYVRMELWRFFDGVRFYNGPLLTKIMRFDTQNLWLRLYCTTEAAYVMTRHYWIDFDGKRVFPIGSISDQNVEKRQGGAGLN